MAGLTVAEVERLLTFQPPHRDQQARYEVIRNAGKALGVAIVLNTPASPDQSAAIRKVREAVMTANASIALEERPARSARGKT